MDVTRNLTMDVTRNPTMDVTRNLTMDATNLPQGTAIILNKGFPDLGQEIKPDSILKVKTIQSKKLLQTM
jgi:hypothetical protein